MISSYGVGCEFGMLGEQRPLVGVIAQDLHRGGQLVAGGVGAGAEQAGGEHAELVGVRRSPSSSARIRSEIRSSASAWRRWVIMSSR